MNTHFPLEQLINPYAPFESWSEEDQLQQVQEYLKENVKMDSKWVSEIFAFGSFIISWDCFPMFFLFQETLPSTKGDMISLSFAPCKSSHLNK